MEGWFAPLTWLFARHPRVRDAFGQGLVKLGLRFYVLLAVACAIAGAADQFLHSFSHPLANASFDWVIRNRPIAYRADPSIVLLDIDEVSLGATAAELGRWPWPRSTLATVARKLEEAHAQAVVFDILFADPDVTNPASEAEFDRYVTQSRNSFFPILRLNPANDVQSEITLSMLNFARRDSSSQNANVDEQRTIALLPPYFKSIYDSTRSGTHNIYPDPDNVVRWYQNYELLGGYRIPSLPDRMAQVLGWREQSQANSLINWPRDPMPYTTISFCKALEAIKRHDDSWFNRFGGAIVLIGSTAPSLNDIKATPVESLHPGVYVLATAIDNTKHHRFLRPLSRASLWCIELLLLGASCYLFVATEQAYAVAKFFFIIPTALLGISLLSVTASDLLIDLSVPAALVLTYFTIAKLFETYSHDYVTGTGAFAPTAGEIAHHALQVASLPKSMTRRQVLDVVRRYGPPVKLWDPPALGLGKEWNAQAWILWRRGAIASHRVADEERHQWFDVRADGLDTGGSDTRSALAQSIASAMQTLSKESNNPGGEPNA